MKNRKEIQWTIDQIEGLKNRLKPESYLELMAALNFEMQKIKSTDKPSTSEGSRMYIG